jgi:peptidoglycan-N-acetylglucosamine deacetylase
VDRRSFLRRAGLVVGGAGVGAAATGGYGAAHELVDPDLSGHAVGSARPPDLTSTTLTYRVRTQEPWVALTFDDGPSKAYTARILDILAVHNVVATFNMIGRHAHALPELAHRVASTHEIGNHTWSHPDMSRFDAVRARRELQRGSDAIEAATGRRPAVYRPPYGRFSAATLMTATSLRYPVVLWDRAFDQHGPTARDNVDRIVQGVGGGSIILAHDGGTLNCAVVVSALSDLIQRVHARGLRFVTTSTLLAAAEPQLFPTGHP